MTEAEALMERIRKIKEGPFDPDVADKQLTFGQRAADRIAATIGSWPFLISQTAVLTFWIWANSSFIIKHWDSYPYILLNLCLSFQAAYSAPAIMMSQNRQSAKDRLLAENTYRMNCQIDRVLDFLVTHIELQHRVQLDILHRIEDDERKEITLCEDILDEVQDGEGHGMGTIHD